MIPKTVHFAFFHERDFPFYALLAVKSAQSFLDPEKIHLYRAMDAPDFSGEWWDLAKDAVEIVRVQPPKEIFGRPLKHQAHEADVFRLQVLIEQGGIYLDMDTICCGPFDRLLNQKCVLGHQTPDQNFGLCNAVVLAEKQSEFLRMWLDEYVSFRSTGKDQYWDEHSVKLPLKLARKIKPGDQSILHIEPNTTFFAPSFEKNELKRLFENAEVFPTSLAHHLWASCSYKRYLMHLTPEIIYQVPTSYNLIARKVMDFTGWKPRPAMQSLPGKTHAQNDGHGGAIKPSSSTASDQTSSEPTLLNFIKSRRLRGTYVDIGAGRGNYSQFFLKETACSRLIAIEADDQVLPVLRSNLSATTPGRESQYQILNEVVSFPQSLFFNLGHSIEGGYGSYFSSVRLGENSVAVKTRSLDDLLADETKIVFLKVSVGENLMPVIGSGGKLLRSQWPDVCLQVKNCEEDAFCEFMEQYDFLPLVKFPGPNIYFMRFSHLFVQLVLLIRKLPAVISTRVEWRFVRFFSIISGRLPWSMLRSLFRSSDLNLE